MLYALDESVSKMQLMIYEEVTLDALIYMELGLTPDFRFKSVSAKPDELRREAVKMYSLRVDKGRCNP